MAWSCFWFFWFLCFGRSASLIFSPSLFDKTCCHHFSQNLWRCNLAGCFFVQSYRGPTTSCSWHMDELTNTNLFGIERSEMDFNLVSCVNPSNTLSISVRIPEDTQELVRNALQSAYHISWIQAIFGGFLLSPLLARFSLSRKTRLPFFFLKSFNWDMPACHSSMSELSFHLQRDFSGSGSETLHLAK